MARKAPLKAPQEQRRKRKMRYLDPALIRKIIRLYDVAPFGAGVKVLRKYKITTSHIAYWRRHQAKQKPRKK